MGLFGRKASSAAIRHCHSQDLVTVAPRWEVNSHCCIFLLSTREDDVRSLKYSTFSSQNFKVQIAKCFDKGKCCNPCLIIRKQRAGSQVASPLQRVSRKAVNHITASHDCFPFPRLFV